MSGVCSAHQHREPGCKQCEADVDFNTGSKPARSMYIYLLYRDACNYERLNIKYDNNDLIISYENAGIGISRNVTCASCALGNKF